MLLPETMQPGEITESSAWPHRRPVSANTNFAGGAVRRPRRPRAPPRGGVGAERGDDEPLMGPLEEAALRFEAEADRRGDSGDRETGDRQSEGSTSKERE